MQLLLEKGADVNAQGGEYGNALQAAMWEGCEAVVQLLLEKGADINAQGGKYGNALQAASWEGHEAVLQLLLEKGADVNAQDGQYGNALQMVSVRTCHRDYGEGYGKGASAWTRRSNEGTVPTSGFDVPFARRSGGERPYCN